MNNDKFWKWKVPGVKAWFWGSLLGIVANSILSLYLVYLSHNRLFALLFVLNAFVAVYAPGKMSELISNYAEKKNSL